MESIILDLQRDTLNRTLCVADLLRKALLVSHKLGITEFETWINKELNGYEKIIEVPEYRILRGKIKAWKPFKGWQPLIFPDDEAQEAFSKRRFYHSIAEIEAMINREKKDFLHMPYPANIEKQLRDAIGFDTEVTLIIPVSSLVRIVDTVRTTILNWSLKLEEDGIIGEGISFSLSEKERARFISYEVNNFHPPISHN